MAGTLSRRWLFDSSIYILVLRDETFARAFRPRYLRDIPRTHFSSVVIEELLAGVRTNRHRAQAEELFAPFERARRIVTPGHAVWKEAGNLMAALSPPAGERSSPPQGFLNDALIALSARSIGATIVTRNAEDFRRIQRSHRFGLEII